jgi:hypothetical protein
MLPPMQERRVAPRYAMERDVWVRHRRHLPAAATLINISYSGAAVRLRRVARVIGMTWVFCLRSGDEVHLSGLIDDPVACWVVAEDGDVLRVRFLPDDGTRPAMDDLVARLAGE